MKIRPMLAELSHMEGRTDGRTTMTKLTVAFRNFANASKNLFGLSAYLIENHGNRDVTHSLTHAHKSTTPYRNRIVWPRITVTHH
jgi:hypothetical protein